MLELLNIDTKHLDEQKQQTEYKIKYIIEYVKLWLIISSERENINTINFIDCMCNAGIYKNSNLGTSIEVLKLFFEAAKKHPNKQYVLHLNDYDKHRVDTTKKLINHFYNEPLTNVKVVLSNADVNEYLQNFSYFNKYLGYGSSNILFVDPYDLGTVVIQNLSNFLKKYYSELIFNFFTSDYVRNKLDHRIKACIGNTNIQDKKELISFIGEQLRVGKINYVFSYEFRTKTNTELYQIIFATPSYKGLDVVKQALWDVFNGSFNHRNKDDNSGQMTLFSEDDDKKMLLNIHASDAKKILVKKFKGEKVSYQQIEKHLAETTMMMSSQFLKNVIKPLIEESLLTKCGDVGRANNYKKDNYIFGGEEYYENYN